MPRHTLALAACLVALAAPASAGPPTKEQAAFFETRVRPVLAEHCFKCHSDAEKKRKGGLAVDSLAALLQGGETGPAVVPGHPEKSLLVTAVGHATDLKMPPKGKLSAAEVEALTTWVKTGAPWPNAAPGGMAKRKPGTITDDDRKWWAFQPVKRPAVPGSGHPIDAFVRARLQKEGLTPAPEAPRAVLIRRVTFDLTGLPPTPAEVAAFETDTSPDAYEKLVDRLLASPRYGERWARHWLDLVRYADSDGYRIDDYRPTAWRYRDYVIRSFNADKPYDRFVKEQLAGDELFPGDPDAVVATGYLRHWIYEYNQRDVRTQWEIILTDVTDTTGDVFLGLGLQCARCHDHKFDPILQKDYFRLQAYFANILPREDLIAATTQEKAEHAAKLKAWEEKTAAIRAEIDRIEGPYRKRAAEAAIIKFPPETQAMIRKPAAERTPFEHQIAELAYRQVTYEFDRLDRTLKGTDKERVLALRRELAKLDSLKPPPLPVALAATDVGPTAPPTLIPKKGKEPIEPGVLTLLDEKPMPVEPLANSSGRRAALANWLTRPDNPLTARVLVNRLWQQHFGKGLAANASDFGRLGDPPTHPELLDWLASEFVEPTPRPDRQGGRDVGALPDGRASAWSIKRLHRLIVTSATYKQSADHPAAAAGRLKDPENRLLWRGTVRRLDAEQIRDAIFAVTGELDLTAGGPGVAAGEPRRTVFTKVMRNTRDPLLDVFDAPLGFTSTAARDTTTTPIQSLTLANNPVLLRRARALAERLEKESPGDDAAKLDRAYRLAFGRPPTAEEASAARAFLAEQAKRIDPKRAASAAAAFVGGKIPYRDGQAADLRMDTGHPGFPVPHADMLPKGDFTIEAFVYTRSVADTAAVRTIAGKWAGSLKEPGWGFAVTGKGSRRKPQTLVMQMIGTKAEGTLGEEAVFSDQHIALNKPYYVAAAVRLATATEPGLVTFYVKDLSNDDEPLLTAKVKHAITGGLANTQPLVLGNRGKGTAGFDGLLDDVRLSDTALGVDQLLFTHEGTNRHTVGYWQFEAKPDVFRDGTGHGLDIRPAPPAAAAARDVKKAAWADLCHVLLNASEFLYVE
jgi:hypothetical protein